MNQPGNGKFWADNLIYGLATAGAGVFNWLYAIVLAHGVGPIWYGGVSTLNNVVAIMTLPASIITLAAIRRGKPAERLWRWRAAYGASGMVLWAILAGLARFLSQAFHLAPGLFLLFGLSSWPVIDFAANLGYLARARRYQWLGGLTMAGSGLSVADVVIAIHLKNPVAALGVLQSLSVWALWAVSVRMVASVTVEPPASRRSVALSAGVGVVQGLTTLTDGVVAKARLAPEAAGLYNGLATVGQALPFAAASLALVMLTAMLENPGGRKRWLRWTLAVYLALGLGLESLFLAVPHVVVQAVLGARFDPVVPWLAVYGGGMLALGTVLIFLAEAIARGWWALLAAAMAGLVLWVALLLRAQGLGGLVHATALSLLFTALGIVVLRTWLQHRAVTG